MNPVPDRLSRLRFLVRVVAKECKHLAGTDERLFTEPFTAQRAVLLDTDSELAERAEAFVSRFGRLQDTLSDKLLPALLSALGEKPATVIDNLDRAERLGWVASVNDWTTLRALRNQMVHEYVEDPRVLANALEAAHGFVPTLLETARRMLDEAARRGWT